MAILAVKEVYPNFFLHKCKIGGGNDGGTGKKYIDGRKSGDS